MLFVSANLDIAIQSLTIFPREVKIRIVPLFAGWDKVTQCYSSKSIKPINIVVSFVSHSVKSGTIDILTYLGKIAISPDCNILIG